MTEEQTSPSIETSSEAPQKENRPPLTPQEQIAAAKYAREAWGEEDEFKTTDDLEKENARLLLEALLSGNITLEDASSAISGRHAETRAALERDQLTSMLVRSAGEARMEEIIALDERNSQSTSAIMIDLDDLKLANGPGHLTGDTAIESAAEYILSNVRKYDLAFRYGGDEDMIVLPQTRKEEALEVAKRIYEGSSDAISESAEEKGFPLPHPITFSVGVAQIEPGSGDISAAKIELIELSDEASRVAKFLGKNRIVSVEVIKDERVFTDQTTNERYTVEINEKGEITKANPYHG